MKKNSWMAFCVLASVIGLSGCIPILIGAAAGGGAYFVTKNQGFKSFASDNQITNQAVAKIKADSNLQGSRVEVAVKNGTMLLVGEVSNPDLRNEAAQLMQSISGVRRIYNALIVAGPISPLTISSDSWITTKIKSQMTVTKGFSSNQVKVVTENGTVYLMGAVSQDQGNTASDIARTVAGVQKVVKLFDYTS